ncbi:MAG: hypothetical protein KBH03_03425 [Paludibacteraceae bacterium]|nr:hypothetical protein [Paludibacteraceae bacterium]
MHEVIHTTHTIHFIVHILHHFITVIILQVMVIMVMGTMVTHLIIIIDPTTITIPIIINLLTQQERAITITTAHPIM